MASISGTVTIAGDPDDWIAVAWDADTHAYAGVAAVSGGAYEITGLTAGKAYVVGCRPMSGPVWSSARLTALNDYVMPTDPEQTPYLFKATSITADDAYFSDVALLLPMNGANNSTTFTDVKGGTITRYGNTKISTDQSKFGGASGYFDGSGDYLTFTHASPTTTNAFTLECWCYISAWPSAGNVMMIMNFEQSGNSANGIINLEITSSGVLGCYIYPNAIYISGGTVTTNTWHHVAVTRSGNTFRIFLDGTLLDSNTNTVSFGSINGAIGIQPSITSRVFSGYIDDVRITRGVARYTDTFTPSSSASIDYAGAKTTASEPTWPTTPGNTMDDGGITWTNMGQFVRPLMHGPLVAA